MTVYKKILSKPIAKNLNIPKLLKPVDFVLLCEMNT